MVNFWRVVNSVIKEADAIVEVVDARTVENTRNIEIEDKIKKVGKKLIVAINKCDMISKKESEAIQKRVPNSIFISSVERLGTRKLREKILRSSNKKEIKVGVLGYPNTGKSSLINALKGRAVARVSAQSGHTRGLQLIRISKRLTLIDTPGVFPYKEKDEGKHAMTSARSTHDIKDLELAVLELIESLNGKIEKHYRVKKHKDTEETLEAIAIKLKKLKKRGVPNTKLAARTIIQDWQAGKI
ncbi:MAG: GTPase [Candidatus Nanoarchaeia archaeon]